MDDVGCRVARLVMQLDEAAVSVASKHGNVQTHVCLPFFLTFDGQTDNF